MAAVASALAVALIAGGASTAVAALPSQVRGFLSLSDADGPINGGASFRREEHTIEIKGYQMSFSYEGSPFCAPMVVKTGFNQAWPILASDATGSSQLPTARLDLWKSGAKEIAKFHQYTLSNANLDQVDEVDADSETLTISFTDVEEKTWRLNAGGTPSGSPITREIPCHGT